MNSTRDVTNEFLRRLAEESPEEIAALFADEIDFLCAGSDLVPWIRPRRIRADMEDFFTTMAAAFTPEGRVDQLSLLLVDGNEAVILGYDTQRLRSNNVAFTSPFALRLTVEDGKIVRYHIYEDSLTVAEAVAGQAAGVTTPA